jgi:hypothetical protein
VICDILEVFDCTRYLPTIDGLGGFAGVFERDPKVSTTSTRRFGGCDLSCCVADLIGESSKYFLCIACVIYSKSRNGMDRVTLTIVTSFWMVDAVMSSDIFL